MWHKLKVKRYSKQDDRAYPGADGSLVKDKECYFDDMMYDEFWEPKPEFNYLSFETPKMFDQEAWILLDAHTWIGEYPDRLWSFIISKKLKDIFEKHNLIASTFYKSKLKFKGTFFDYFVFHTLDNGWSSVVDFDNCFFTEYENVGFKKIGYNNIKIIDYPELKAKSKMLKKETRPSGNTLTYGPEKIIFTKAVDLVLFPKLFWVISQRLKDAIESEGITGLEITPIDNVEFVGGQ